MAPFTLPAIEQTDLFPHAKPARARPLEPIVRTAEVEGCYRWSLRRAWGQGPCVGWAMLNPSTADATRDDPTLWQIMCISLRLGFGSLVVVNVYPFRSSTIQGLGKWLQTWSHYALEPDINARAAVEWNQIKAAKALRGCETVVAAWGASASKTDVATWISKVEDGLGGPIAWKCLGVTASKAPRHPLARGKHRIPADQQLLSWRQP